MTRGVGALEQRIAACAQEIGGVLGVAVTHLPTRTHVGFNEDALFPLASVVKVPLLVALYAEARGGRVDLAERVTYRRAARVAGSGVLQDLDDGLAPTLGDLAVLMVTVSDNTATDLVLERVGKATVERTMTDLGLTSIRVPFGINELLHELVDLRVGEAEYEEVRRRLRESAGSGGRAVIPEESDRGTPRDLCRLFELLESRAILDDAACAKTLDICLRQKFSDRIPGRLPPEVQVAHKTGSIRGVRNDAGVVYAPSGPYAIALFTRGLADAALASRALADLSLEIYRHFNP